MIVEKPNEPQMDLFIHLFIYLSDCQSNTCHLYQDYVIWGYVVHSF